MELEKAQEQLPHQLHDYTNVHIQHEQVLEDWGHLSREKVKEHYGEDEAALKRYRDEHGFDQQTLTTSRIFNRMEELMAKGDGGTKDLGKQLEESESQRKKLADDNSKLETQVKELKKQLGEMDDNPPVPKPKEDAPEADLDKLSPGDEIKVKLAGKIKKGKVASHPYHHEGKTVVCVIDSQGNFANPNIDEVKKWQTEDISAAGNLPANPWAGTAPPDVVYSRKPSDDKNWRGRFADWIDPKPRQYTARRYKDGKIVDEETVVMPPERENGALGVVLGIGALALAAIALGLAASKDDHGGEVNSLKKDVITLQQNYNNHVRTDNSRGAVDIARDKADSLRDAALEKRVSALEKKQEERGAKNQGGESGEKNNEENNQGGGGDGLGNTSMHMETTNMNKHGRRYVQALLPNNLTETNYNGAVNIVDNGTVVVNRVGYKENGAFDKATLAQLHAAGYKTIVIQNPIFDTDGGPGPTGLVNHRWASVVLPK
jgi:hypothetical protein